MDYDSHNMTKVLAEENLYTLENKHGTWFDTPLGKGSKRIYKPTIFFHSSH